MNGNHRIFIAISLPDNVNKKLMSFKEKWPELEAAWTKEYNLHITLAFLGYVREENIPDIIKKTKKALKGYESFEIRLNKICYGPPNKFPPRMIWAEGEKSKELAVLQDSLEKALFTGINQNIEKYIANIKSIEREEKKPFSLHITLARIKQMAFNKMEREEIPEINEDINLSFTANSVEIMESELKKGGPSYTVLESIQFFG